MIVLSRYQSAKTQKRRVPLIAFSTGRASEWSPSPSIRMQHAYSVGIALLMEQRGSNTSRLSHIISVLVIPKWVSEALG